MKTRILIPPGIGDSYWVLVKLRALMKQRGIERPELTVLSWEDPRGAHLRSLPYLKMFDWLDIGDPPSIPYDPALQTMWDEALLGPGRSIFENVLGYDLYVAYNGRVNSGGWIEDDDLECDWYPPMRVSAAVRIIQSMHDFLTRFTNYAVLFFPMYGTYESLVASFPVENIVEAVVPFLKETGLLPVFVGADWDMELNQAVYGLMKQIPKSVDLIGKTDLHELFGLMKGARMVIGYHAGATNMAAVLGAKTLLLWDDRWPRNTAWAVVPPNRRHRTYIALHTEGLTAEAYLHRMLELFNSDGQSLPFEPLGADISITREKIESLRNGHSDRAIVGVAGRPEDIFLDEHSTYSWYFAVAAARAPKHIVEFGVRFGYSAIAMIKGAQSVGVKPVFTGVDAEADGIPSNPLAMGNIVTETKLLPAIFKENTGTVNPDRLHKADIVHIDADHSPEGIQREIALAEKCVTPSGLILIDDIDVPHIYDAAVEFGRRIGVQPILLPTQHGLAVIDMKKRTHD